MKPLFITLLLLPGFLVGQQKSIKDTLKLNEVSVTGTLPLRNNDIADFYRTDEFASIDFITARLEGVSMIKRGAYASEPQLNGMSGGQISLTIDGMRIFGACTDKMDPISAYIEPTNLQTISLQQATENCNSGCNLGGTLQMTLNEPVIGRTGQWGYLTTGYESVSNGRNLLLSVGHANSKWGWLLDGVYRKNENYHDGNGKEIRFSQYSKVNAHGAVKYAVNPFSSIKMDVLYDLATDVGYPALPMDVSRAEAKMISLEYARKKNNECKIRLYANLITHIMDDSKRDSLYFVYNNQTGKNDSVYMRMDMPGRSNTFGAFIHYILRWNDHHMLTVKVDNFSNFSLAEMTMYMRYANKPPETPMYMQTWPDMLRTVTGLYAENKNILSAYWQWNNSVRIDLNTDHLRSDYGQQEFSVFGYTVPRSQTKLVKALSTELIYKPDSHYRFSASCSYTERMPTIGERLGYYLYNAYDGYDYIGNPELKPEKAFSTLLRGQYIAAKVRINVSQSVFLLQDYIMGVTQPALPSMNFYAKGLRLYQNINRALLCNTNIQAELHPIRDLTVFILSKYSYGSIDNSTAMPLIAPLRNLMAARYTIRQLTLQAECESTCAQNRINSAYQEQKTPAFTVFNLKTGYRFCHRKTIADTGITCTNLTNKTYYEHLDWGRINRPGRSIDVFLKISY